MAIARLRERGIRWPAHHAIQALHMSGSPSARHASRCRNRPPICAKIARLKKFWQTPLKLISSSPKSFASRL
jgi:hypothetical protein